GTSAVNERAQDPPAPVATAAGEAPTIAARPAAPEPVPATLEHEPAAHEHDDAPETESKSAAPRLLLRIDPTAERTRLRATFDAVECWLADQRPVPCGFEVQCRDMAERWLAQLGFTRDPDFVEVVSTVKARRYPEQACDGAPVRDDDDFTARARLVQQSLGVLALDLVGGLFVETSPGRWRGLARTHETIMSGMATQIVVRPAARWELDVDQRPGRELILLILGEDSGHARDPRIDAFVVVCGARPTPWCGRLALGAWIPRAVREEHRGAPEVAQEDTVQSVELYSDGRLRVGDRELGIDQLGPADRKLDRRWR
ncbi:MAG: hypothetical protein R3B09_31975, partial [Nannocystaceae bacterium]